MEKYEINRLEELLNTIEREILEAISKKCIKERRDDITLLIFSITKSIKLFRETLLLCKNGFPDGALILARNIYEQMIICCFIIEQKDDVKHDGIIEKYFDDYEVTRLKYIIDVAERFNDTQTIEKNKKKLEEF